MVFFLILKLISCCQSIHPKKEHLSPSFPRGPARPLLSHHVLFHLPDFGVCWAGGGGLLMQPATATSCKRRLGWLITCLSLPFVSCRPRMIHLQEGLMQEGLRENSGQPTGMWASGGRAFALSLPCGLFCIQSTIMSQEGGYSEHDGLCPAPPLLREASGLVTGDSPTGRECPTVLLVHHLRPCPCLACEPALSTPAPRLSCDSLTNSAQ